MKKKKILVVYYSRTGNTKKVALSIAKELKAEVDKIIDKTSRTGIKGWIFGGRDAMKKKFTEIEFKKDAKKYDLIILGTPVWAWTLTPAMRTYLVENKDNLKKVAFFSTFGGNVGKTFEEMARISKKPLATLGLKENEIENIEKIKEFCKKIN